MDLFGNPFHKFFGSFSGSSPQADAAKELEIRALQGIDALGFDSKNRLELMRDEVLSALEAVFLDCNGTESITCPLLRFPGHVELKLEITSTNADRSHPYLQTRAELLRLAWNDVVLCHRLHYHSDLVELWEVGGDGRLKNHLKICQFEEGAEVTELDDGSSLKLITGLSSAHFPGISYPWTITYRTARDAPLRVLTIDNQEGTVWAYKPKFDNDPE